MQLALNTRTIDGVLVVDCNGRIVFGEESALLRDAVRKLITDNNHIVLNLSCMGSHSLTRANAEYRAKCGLGKNFRRWERG